MRKVVFFAFVFVLFLLSVNGMAQIEEERLPTLSVGTGYFGELITHPGIILFGEYALNASQNQYLTRVNIINYRHKAHSINRMITPELVFRRNTQKYIFIELALGCGWLFQKPDTRVLEYKNGNFEETSKGWNYLAPSLAIRAGKSFLLSNNHSLTPSIGLRGYYQYPFNDAWIIRTAIDFSLSYSLK